MFIHIYYKNTYGENHTVFLFIYSTNMSIYTYREVHCDIDLLFTFDILTFLSILQEKYTR